MSPLDPENEATLTAFGVTSPQTVSEFRIMRDDLNDLLNAAREEERAKARAIIAKLTFVDDGGCIYSAFRDTADLRGVVPGLEQFLNESAAPPTNGGGSNG